MQSKRFIAIGALSGILAGILLSLVFPNLLMFGAEYRSASNTQLGLPDYTSTSGSILNSLIVFPMLLGILGGIFGLITFKLKQLK